MIGFGASNLLVKAGSVLPPIPPTPDDCQDIQTLIDVTYGLLYTEQTLLSDLQSQKAALIAAGSAEVTSVSQGGEGGEESWTLLALTQQINASATRLREITNELRELMKLQNARFPRIVRIP